MSKKLEQLLDRVEELLESDRIRNGEVADEYLVDLWDDIGCLIEEVRTEA